MQTYIIVYEDFKYGTCWCSYETSDIFDAINQFMCEGNGDKSIISITVGR